MGLALVKVRLKLKIKTMMRNVQDHHNMLAFNTGKRSEGGDPLDSISLYRCLGALGL